MSLRSIAISFASARSHRHLREAQKRVADSLDDEPLICRVDVSGVGAAWSVMAFRRGTDARSIPRIRIPGEHTRDRSVLVGKLAEILRDQRPTRKVAAMFIDMAFGSPISYAGPHQGQYAGPTCGTR
jgi:hypothetical protein